MTPDRHRVSTESQSHSSQLTDFVPRAQAARQPLPQALQAGQLLRHGLLLLAAGCGLGAVALLALERGNDTTASAAVVIGVLGLAALSSLRAPAGWLPNLFSVWAAAIVLAIAGSAAALGWGLLSPALLMPPLLVMAVAGTVGPRPAAGVAAIAAACLGLLTWHGTPALPAGSLRSAHLLVLQFSALGLGWMGGRLLFNSLQCHHAMASQRESRYRGLLALAADAYWEIDADYRISAAVYNHDEGRQLNREGGLGSVPWRLPRFVCHPDVLDQLLAELDARVPLRDLPVGWQALDGQERRFLISGEPRFGERGEFLGYWGVARDITADTAAREKLAATETRYQELFTRIPTPLVLHRHGRVVEANPAAVALFVGAEQGSLRGVDILQFYEAGESRDRARQRVQELENAAPGKALPVTDYRLQLPQRTAWVRATGVRVQAEGGPATLAIYIDDTERRQADEAVQRSESMLSHLVATSPDLITLTELATGRYLMVNQAYERITGHSASDAVGRTSLELNIWRSEEDRRDFVAAVQRRGTVTDMPLRFRKRNGDECPLLVSAARFMLDRHEYLVINARDVTANERARLEREAILANASVGIAVTSNRVFVLANHHFEALYGWDAGEIIGQPGSVVWPGDADYAEVGAIVHEPLMRGEAVELERSARRRDGSCFLARIRGRAVDPRHPQDSGTVWIVEDVTERREAEATLARARDDAEAASRAKTAFLANTSHELRTPLNGIIGLAQLAREPGLPPATRTQFLEQICDSAQSLAEIISDILDLSKIEAGKLELNAAVFDLGELLAALHRSFGTLASARGLALNFEPATQAQGPVWGDALRVRQIMTNYLANALKFTAEGSITLTARRLFDPALGGPGACVRLEVRDTGLGVPTETQARLFMPFTQADESTTRQFGGTGLGLSICRELATLMGGQVGVDSQAGQGSCFWAELQLPVAQATALPVALPAPDVRLLQGRRVLMVEDNSVNMLIAVTMMEGWGLVVAQAQDGIQALAAVQQAFDDGEPFDAVLMDVQMPRMGGHEATRALRNTQAGCHLPIIALTAAALVSERSTALEAGMNDFLTKPVDAERLRSSLARWLLPVVR